MTARVIAPLYFYLYRYNQGRANDSAAQSSSLSSS
jgi:hypothetical protein